MSGYSASAGGRREAYGSVTRVVIASSTSPLERVQPVSPPSERWWSDVNQRQRDSLTLPPNRPRGDGHQPQIASTRVAPAAGGDGRLTAAADSKDVNAVTTDAVVVQPSKQQHRRHHEHVDQRQRAASTALVAAPAQHSSHRSQHINTVTRPILCDAVNKLEKDRFFLSRVSMKCMQSAILLW